MRDLRALIFTASPTYVTVFGKEISLNFTSEVENAVFAKRNLPRS
jgi:hypothetical protein